MVSVLKSVDVGLVAIASPFTYLKLFGNAYAPVGARLPLPAGS